jgi:hypothetical protein
MAYLTAVHARWRSIAEGVAGPAADWVVESLSRFKSMDAASTGVICTPCSARLAHTAGNVCRQGQSAACKRICHSRHGPHPKCDCFRLGYT